MYGKLLGAIAGAAAGLLAHSPATAVVLAAVGALVGHLVDSSHADPEPDLAASLTPGVAAPGPETAGARARAAFARHLCTLCVEVARADGPIVQDEIHVVREFFEKDLLFAPDELEQVRLLLKEAVATPRDLAAAAQACRDELLPSERLLLVNALYELALADGPLKRAEGDTIRAVVAGLQVSDEDHRSISAVHLGLGGEHYSLLGLEPGAADDEVKAAYRRLAAAHHPDKVAHLGHGPVEVASRRFRELKDAYDEIRRLRGLL